MPSWAYQSHRTDDAGLQREEHTSASLEDMRFKWLSTVCDQIVVISTSVQKMVYSLETSYFIDADP